MIFNSVLKSNSDLNYQLFNRLSQIINNGRIEHTKSIKKLRLFDLKHVHTTQNPQVFHQLVRGGSHFKRFNRSPYYQNEFHVVKEVYSESGAIGDMPRWYKLGILKIILNIVAFVSIGAMISKTAVTFLEENDIFKPEEDDDEDDD